MCIEREQPSTALKTMPHYTTWGGTHFSAGPDVYHPEFQPEGDDFIKLGDIKGEVVDKDNKFMTNTFLKDARKLSKKPSTTTNWINADPSPYVE